MKKCLLLGAVLIAVSSTVIISLFNSTPTFAEDDFPLSISASWRVGESVQVDDFYSWVTTPLIVDLEITNLTDKTINNIRAFYEFEQFTTFDADEQSVKIILFDGIVIENRTSAISKSGCYLNLLQKPTIGDAVSTENNYFAAQEPIPLKGGETRTIHFAVLTSFDYEIDHTDKIELNLYISWVKFSRGGWGSAFSIPQWQTFYQDGEGNYYPSSPIEYDLEAVTVKIDIPTFYNK
ncbi:MAG: hypothetical protein FWH42_02535 [Dehalococcoidia bacterium]|nr:hypothetical protein [Dehalococcoidia bacterium]